LTPLRRAILAALATGATDVAIAARLGLTAPALRAHLRALYRALPLGAATNKRTAAAVWYRRALAGAPCASAGPPVPVGGRPALTPTQWRLLALLAAGHDTVAIAACIGLSESAVRHHLKGAYAALPLGNATNRRVAAAVWYRREGHRYHAERAE
jgi:DNA-binding NarL/FixJ family response regulator